MGYTVNPSAGSGLGVCTLEQYESETFSSLPGSGCPEESKIGSVAVETPVLTENLTGSIYIAKPFANKFDSLLGLYIVVKDPERGIIVKLAGKIEPNPVTGQLVTTFDENPQVPFSKFTLKLRQGATSPLVSPPACGTYTAQADFTSWSEPLTAVPLADSFQIEDGIGGGACPAGGIPPFKPGLVAGTLNNSAGSYSPMDIHITRNDGEQEITGFSSQLPPGLTASLIGVPFCSEADIALARTKTGAQEETEPSCPVASEIGHTLVGAGVGSVLAYTPGKVYLAGPFEGAPFSIAAITSAKVGPFDLGTVVVHLPLFINPQTAAVSIPAGAPNQIPHIIDGIVIHVRDIRVYIERKNFMINPTNCNPETFSATVIGGGADPANPQDNTPATTNDSFQAANCQTLTFKPKFSVSTSGKTSKADGASLTAKLSYPEVGGHSIFAGGQANIARVKVDLPKQLPSRLTTLQKACTAAQFNTNPAGCPAASFIGHARAITPILPVPLEGPAIFVSHGGEAFPSLKIVLQGYGVTIDLVGSTFISKQGITFEHLQDRPRRPRRQLRTDAPRGQILRPRRQRESVCAHQDGDNEEDGEGEGPWQDQGGHEEDHQAGSGIPGDADLVCCSERRGNPSEYAGYRQWLREGQGVKAGHREAAQGDECATGRSPSKQGKEVTNARSQLKPRCGGAWSRGDPRRSRGGPGARGGAGDRETGRRFRESVWLDALRRGARWYGRYGQRGDELSL